MLAFLVRRLLFSIAVLLLVSLGACWFFTQHFYQPGSLLQADPWQVYWDWLRGLPRGSFGHGYLGQSLWLQYRWPILHTAILLAATFALVAVGAIALGTLSAVRAGTSVDTILRWLTYAAWGLPAFLLAFLLQKVLGYFLPASVLSHWPGACPIPLTGGFYNGRCSAGGGLHYARKLVVHLTLPSLALATSFIGIHARYLRSSLLVNLNAPYAVVARAKGLTERRVVFRHVLRYSLIAFTSALLLDVGSIFGAAMAVDAVFQLNGLGQAFLNTIATPQIDPNAVQFILVVTAAFVLFTSVLSDLIVVWLDPRIQLR